MRARSMNSRCNLARPHLILIVAVAILCSCGPGYAVSNSSHRCAPPQYPSLQVVPMKVRQVVSTVSDDPVEQVRDVYIRLLRPVDWQNTASSSSYWRIQSVAGSYLLQCISSPNRYEVEVGCILISPQDHRTLIKRLWALSEGGVGCANHFDLPAIWQ